MRPGNQYLWHSHQDWGLWTFSLKVAECAGVPEGPPSYFLIEAMVFSFVLAYFENKMFLWSRKSYEVRGWRPRIFKKIKITKGQEVSEWKFEVVALAKIWRKKFEKFCPKYSGPFSNFFIRILSNATTSHFHSEIPWCLEQSIQTGKCQNRSVWNSNWKKFDRDKYSSLDDFL